jgi:hypothetical protein
MKSEIKKLKVSLNGNSLMKAVSTKIKTKFQDQYNLKLLFHSFYLNTNNMVGNNGRSTYILKYELQPSPINHAGLKVMVL